MNTIFEEMAWLNEPIWQISAGALIVNTHPNTDFWQRTHYGFRRDNGHALLKEISPNSSIRAHFAFTPNAQYDQCGILIRTDENNWFKCSIEYETPTQSRLGSVLTTSGYSDWATQDIASQVKEMWYEVELKNADLTAKFSQDGKTFHQMRIGHLNTSNQKIHAGIYGCTPTGKGFEFKVSTLTIIRI